MQYVTVLIRLFYYGNRDPFRFQAKANHFLTVAEPADCDHGSGFNLGLRLDLDPAIIRFRLV